jgi:hypothetical protein
VEKVANVLYLVMQDNPNLQRLYLTGIFFFIMMYTGSNVLPVARSDCWRDAHGHACHTHTLCSSDRSFYVVRFGLCHVLCFPVGS